jgi:hypothetical protein
MYEDVSTFIYENNGFSPLVFIGGDFNKDLEEMSILS